MCCYNSESFHNLFIDSIYKREDGYWAFEENQNTAQNPTRNHLFSVCHLYHNITGSPGLVTTFKEQGSNEINVLSYYYFPTAVQPFDIKNHCILT